MMVVINIQEAKAQLTVEASYEFGSGKRIFFTPSPAIENLTCNFSGLEIVTGTNEFPNSNWYMFSSGGILLSNLPTGDDESMSSPAIADINMDDICLEIAGGTTSGKQIQVFSFTPFPYFLGKYEWQASWNFHASPAVGDLDPTPNTGLEVVDARLPPYNPGGVHATYYTGAPFWHVGGPFFDDCLILSTPAIGDVNPVVPGLEVVIPYTHRVSSGMFMASVDIRRGSNGVSLASPGSRSGYIFASPAIANLDGIGSPETILVYFDGFVRVDGTTSWTTQLVPPSTPTDRYEGYFLSSPAVADIDFDGNLEVIVAGNIVYWNLPGGYGTQYACVWALDGATGTVEHELWREHFTYVWSSPAIAQSDYSISPRMSVYFGTMDGRLIELEVPPSYSPSIYVCEFDTLSEGITSSPSVADIDGDGRLEVVFLDDGQTRARDAPGHIIWFYNEPTPRFFQLGGRGDCNTFWIIQDDTSNVPPFTLEWPMFRANPQRTGLYEPSIPHLCVECPPELPPPADAIAVWQNQDPTSLDWDIWYSVWDDTSRDWWTPAGTDAAPIAILPDNDHDPAIAFSRRYGDALAVWSHWDTGRADFDIWYSRWLGPSIGWTPPTSLAQINGDDTDPAIAFLPDGTAIAIWVHTYSDGTRRIFYSVWNGFSWVGPNDILVGPPAAWPGEASLPEIAVTSQYGIHKAIAIWVDHDVTIDYAVHYSIWDGTTWSSPTEIPGQTITAHYDAWIPAWRRIGISSGAGGKAGAVWSCINNELHSSIWDGWTWTTPLVIPPISGWEMQPAIASNRKSTFEAMVTYTDRSDIWYFTRDEWAIITRNFAADSGDTDHRPATAFLDTDIAMSVWEREDGPGVWEICYSRSFFDMWDPADIISSPAVPGVDKNPAIASRIGSPSTQSWMRDFYMDVIPLSVSPIFPGQNLTYTIGIYIPSEMDDELNISLNVTPPPELDYALSIEKVTLPPGGSARSTLTVITYPETPTGTYTLTVRSTDGIWKETNNERILTVNVKELPERINETEYQNSITQPIDVSRIRFVHNAVNEKWVKGSKWPITMELMYWQKSTKYLIEIDIDENGNVTRVGFRRWGSPITEIPYDLAARSLASLPPGFAPGP
jgi:hypothetical protein